LRIPAVWIMMYTDKLIGGTRMGYLALYRAWRPEKFEDVVGQEAIVRTLVSQVESGRIAHAYLFCGSRGTGKTSTAKILARAINCAAPLPGAAPCGRCDACVAIGQERAMDVVEIDAASNNGVDEIRDLREKIQYPPSVGRYKVYIVDEVHMLSTGAFNALLKTLEEPPGHAVFILATTEPQKLPATILSRCQRFDFRRIPARLIEGLLKKVVDSTGADAQPEALEMIARAAEGGMRDALSMLDTCLAGGELTTARVREALGASGSETMYALADALIASDAGRALVLIGHAMEAGRDPMVFAREMTGHLRKLLLAQAVREGLEDLIESTREEAERLHAQASGAQPEALARWMDLFMRAESDMKWMAQPRSALELCAFRACRPEREEHVEALMERIARLEAKLEGLASAPFEPLVQSAVKPAAAPEGARPGPAPAKPAKPKRAPDAPGEKARPSGADLWEKAVKAISKEQPQLAGVLKHAAFLGLDGDNVRVEFPRARAFYRQILEKQDKRALVEQALCAAFGRTVHLQLLQAAEAARVDVRTLEQAYDVFGRDKVSVLDDQPGV
jgi:DNA polymerase-3 subunit gamma/tau